jgi:TRAP-type uncharacterized transport system fused permease subunit
MFATGIEAFRLGLAGFLVPFAFVYHGELLLQGSWPQIVLMSILAAVSAVALASFVVGQGVGPVSGWLRWTCLVAAGLMVARAGALQAVGMIVYAAILVLSARRRPPASAISPA